MTSPLVNAIVQSAFKEGAQELLSGWDTLRLAREYSLSPADVDAQALRLGIMPQRYQRNHAAFSVENQIAMLEATVCIVGLGGLGGIMVEGLARLGMGYMRGADGDVFDPSNGNRQILATERTMGMSKAFVARERVARINPAVRFEAVDRFLSTQEMSAFLRGADLVVDCLGGLEYRMALQEAAEQAKIPLVTGAVAGWTGYVGSVLPQGTGLSGDLGNSGNAGESGGSRALVGPARFMDRCAGSAAAEDSLGTQAPGVYSVGALMCCQVAQIITTGKASLDGKMLIMDLLSMDFEKVDISGSKAT
ncbi:MAG: HesA/MoeB/ThiF family protein [Desulfovibrio sp.]|uniref:HesA/MoeB/ThiF family protein n=1 Tax=Desulfovibrio sp. 7SRBS1 TaxID=3378064 RepID=UPI003B415D20